MILLTADQAKALLEICYELDKCLWRMNYPPENERRASAVRYVKVLTEMLRNG